MPDPQDQSDDNEEVNNFSRFVSRIISGIAADTGGSVRSLTAHVDGDGVAGGAADGEGEPLVEVMKEGDSVRLVMELRGASRKDISVLARPEEVCVSFSNEKSSYSRTVAMPCAIDAGASRATFRNGVLEIILARMRGGRAVGIEVR